jgi:hypothetical protein
MFSGILRMSACFLLIHFATAGLESHKKAIIARTMHVDLADGFEHMQHARSPLFSLSFPFPALPLEKRQKKGQPGMWRPRLYLLRLENSLDCSKLRHPHTRNAWFWAIFLSFLSSNLQFQSPGWRMEDTVTPVHLINICSVTNSDPNVALLNFNQ